MTPQDERIKELEAAESHAKSEGDNGNAEISFLAGIKWARENQEPSAELKNKREPRIGYVSFTDEEEGEGGFFSGEITGPDNPRGANLAWLNPVPFIEKFAYDDLLFERQAIRSELEEIRTNLEDVKSILCENGTPKIAQEMEQLEESTTKLEKLLKEIG